MPEQGDRAAALQAMLDAVRSMVKGEKATEDMALERRFNRVEALIDGLQRSNNDGFAGVHERLDRLNGSVGRHEEWIGGHRVDHAMDRGQQLGGMASSARLVGIITIATAIGGVGVALFDALIGK